MNTKNEVFEYLIDQLRQQVNNSPYKQQCEDLAHEVLSLKRELARYKKPYIAYVKKTDWVQGDSRFLKKWGKHRADILRECIQEQDAELQSLKNQLRDASAQIKQLHQALATATGDVEAYKLIRKGEHGPTQSGCRKEDTQVAEPWVKWEGGECPVPKDTIVQIRMRDGTSACEPGVAGELRWGHRGWRGDITRYRVVKPECEHEWRFYNKGASMMCKKCGLNK